LSKVGKQDFLTITVDEETYTIEYKVKSINVLQFIKLIVRVASKIAEEARKDVHHNSILKLKSLHNKLFDKK